MEENRKDYLGELKFLGEDEDKNFRVRVEIVRSGPNRNGWDFQNMDTLGKTFLGTPLLCAYLPNRVGDGHNFKETVLPDGEQILDFTGPTAERIVGMISEDPSDLWTEDREDGTWVIANGKIWRFYNRQLVDKLALQGGMAVSAEIETFDGERDENGIEVYTRWEGLGVTLLHESVPPAVPGANIQAIRAMSEEFKELKFKAASYHLHKQITKEEEETTETNSPKKGVRRFMSLNRREADRLAPKFPGYKIVGLSEDSSQVILMSDSYGLYSYKFSEEYGEGVVADAIQPVKNISVLCGSEDNAVPADLDEIVKNLSGTINTQKDTIENLNAQVKDLRDANDALKTAEHDRRVAEVKAAVQKALAEIEEACDNAENCDNEASAIEANADEYAAMEDGGKFCGADKAYKEIMSAFGVKMSKKLSADKEKSKTAYIWNNGQSGKPAGDSGIDSLLARVNG